MKRIAYSPEFIEQALRKARERGKRTLAVVAVDLNVSLSTLKGWLRDAAKKARGLPHVATPLPSDLPAKAWGARERLQALNESHALVGDALHAWCREKGLYAHQLQTWRDAFCATGERSAKQDLSSLRELQGKHDQLERQLRRKDKALAEAAALLILQKKFQALWADEA
jgi:transposase-like protein